MTRGLLRVARAIVLVMYFNACTSLDTSSIPTDPAVILKGESAFVRNCSGCHNFRQDGIGPQLGGLTAHVSAAWIGRFIRDPQTLMASGDRRAKRLLGTYRAPMPSFAALTDEEMTGIVAFMHTQKAPAPHIATTPAKPLTDPIPDTIRHSHLVVALQLVTQLPASSDSGKLPLTRITKLDFEPQTGRAFVLDLRGRLYQLQRNKPVVYMNMAKLKPRFIHEPGLATGFGSVAFHPAFSGNGILYTTHTESPGSGKADFGFADSIKVTVQWVLTEWKTTNPSAAAFSGTSRELLRVNMVTGIHGVQEITFNPLSTPGDEDYGLLYIGVGDGGSVENGYSRLAHSTDKIWGTILRIDPLGRNSANRQYGIPSRNPFVGVGNALGEIYAYGFRNPHRITWAKSGEMLAPNIGHGNIESINLILPGHDYGWPIREGTFVLDPYGDLNKVYPLPANDSLYGVTYPVAQYDHDGRVAAVSGGFEYWGTAIPDLAGKYFFGDIPSGRLFYLNLADVKSGRRAPINEWRVSVNGAQTTLAELCGTDRVDLHFGRDKKGELYILTKPDGKVYKLVSAAITSDVQVKTPE